MAKAHKKAKQKVQSKFVKELELLIEFKCKLLTLNINSSAANI